MQLDIVTPESQLMSGEVDRVELPGMAGDMTVMGPHAPLVTTLRPGILRVTSSEGTTEYVVTGGFAEIGEAGATILAEQAVPRDEAGSEMVEAERAVAETARGVAEGPERAAIDQRLNDLTVLAGRLGV